MSDRRHDEDAMDGPDGAGDAGGGPELPGELERVLCDAYGALPRDPDGLDRRVHRAAAVELERISGSARPLRIDDAKRRVPWHRRPMVVGVGGVAAAAAVALIAVVALYPPGATLGPVDEGSAAASEEAERPAERSASLGRASEVVPRVLDRRADRSGEAGSRPASEAFGRLESALEDRGRMSVVAAVREPLDVDGDGRVDVLDAFAVARAVERGGEFEAAWDADGDGEVTAADARAVLAMAVRLPGLGVGPGEEAVR